MSGASFWDSLLYGLSLVTSEDEKADIETQGEEVTQEHSAEKLEEKKDE